MLSERERSARESRASRVAAVGEPWITYFDPVSLARDLRGMGFKQVEDFGPEEAKDRYFKDRTDGFRIGESGRLMRPRLGQRDPLILLLTAIVQREPHAGGARVTQTVETGKSVFVKWLPVKSNTYQVEKQ
jgi:hypothetical protein